MIFFVYLIRLTKPFLFSVIISIYNTGRYLDDCIGSLLNQTIGFSRIQIILINDGSTDNSEKVCLKYRNSFEKNIIYIKTEHSGVSKARNIGLKFAKGLYINFMDSDDKWDLKAFYFVKIFFKLCDKVDLVTGRIKYFEFINSYQFIDYKFTKTRLANLTEEYNCLQLSVSCSFFRFSSIKGIKFDENVMFGEDVKFANINLLNNPQVGIVKEAIYYYRKRVDSSSATQNTIENNEFYFTSTKLVQQYLIDKSIFLYNKIQPFIQFYITYEILFRIGSKAFKFLDSNGFKKYCDIIENFLEQVEDKYILEQRIFPPKLQIFALSKKYNRDIRYDFILRNNSFIYSNYVMLDLEKYGQTIIWRIFEVKGNWLHLEGEDRCWLPREKYYYYSKIGNKKIYPKYSYFSGYDFTTMYGIVSKGRIVIFDVKLKKKDMQNLSFFISYMNKDIEILTLLGSFTHITYIINSYYVTESYILIQNNTIFNIYPYDSNLETNLEQNFCSELVKRKKNYLIKFRQEYIEYRKKSKFGDKNYIWLINDRKDQAGDNGEYFFRYLNKIKPKHIRFYFILLENCLDYKRLKIYGNIISFNSTDHLNLFLKADKIISSVSDLWVNNIFDEDGKYMRDLYHFEYIYLQNGIIKDDLSFYLHKIMKNFDLMITSSKEEYNAIFKSNYGYTRKNIIQTGLARFDNLKIIDKKIKREKIILIFPTWRSYIKGTKDLITHESIKSDFFINTTFFQFYNDLINNQKLINFMKEKNYLGILCLHPNFAEQYKYFNQNEVFEVKKKCFDQELIVKSSLLITDYSSIFFDFGYIQKPVIFTQFDIEDYRNNHFPEGYFNYEKDGFGFVCYNMECTIKNIISEIKDNCKLKKKYLIRIKKFFQYMDDKNCYRAYMKIIGNQEKILNTQENIGIILILILFVSLKKLYCIVISK